uniref:4-hydroxy-7-methoxy-3-oxo-3,4-dihydro-2H-1,4-benzoxazin-2-yl glucosidebeta-D-glucosidase n=1 Tax=Leersia perrieri TaxID=77586 RepID=A0A0D9XQ35_9ORYZ
MLKEMGMDAYRFSISWSRILPRGTVQGGINLDGIRYYRNLIDTLKENGIETYVTIFHWDTPQALQDMYGGFLDRRIVDHYRDFAKVCFEYFGDKPYIFSCFSFGTGTLAPGRCSPEHDCAVPSGNSLTEPYIVGHHLLLAHAEAVHHYKKYFQGNDGHIGLALVSTGYVPYDSSSFLDKQAKERCIDYNLGWFLEPVFRGDYPFS